MNTTNIGLCVVVLRLVSHCQTGLHIISNGRSESLSAANAIATPGCMMLEDSEGWQYPKDTYIAKSYDILRQKHLGCKKSVAKQSRIIPE